MHPRDDRPPPGVEFLADPDAPAAPDAIDEPRALRRRTPIVAGLVLVAVLVTVVVTNRPHAGHPTARPTPAVAYLPPPRSAMSCSPIRDGCARFDLPTPPIVALFAHHLPGAIVVAEDSVPDPYSRRLSWRTLEVVSGNVTISVTVTRGSPPKRQSATVLAHDGYVVAFRCAGYYAPTSAQLRAIADDPRLTQSTD